LQFHLSDVRNRAKLVSGAGSKSALLIVKEKQLSMQGYPGGSGIHTFNTLAMDAPKYRTVLLIDDCSIDNFVNKKMILGYHFAAEVHVFQSSMKALAYLEAVDRGEDAAAVPDIIFVDLHMPILDGKEFIAHYEKLSERITGHSKLIVLSGSIDPVEISAVKKAPFVLTLMQKPLIKQNLETIDGLIRGVLRDTRSFAGNS
jgi:CheY-like chemotaxis protein